MSGPVPLRPGERLLLEEAAARLGMTPRELRARLVWSRFPGLGGVTLALAHDAEDRQSEAAAENCERSQNRGAA
jgi:hypothetical protein